MKKRLDFLTVDPEAIKGLYQLEHFTKNANLDPILLELVKMRASQINACAYCLDMHSKDARKLGETEQRLYTLSAWKESPFFTDKERAALEWTEALTLVSSNDFSDELYEKVLRIFGEKDMLALTMSIIAINSWNRLAKPFRSEVGSYQV